MNEIQKNDFVYFRNEILKDMKQIETKINEKVINFYSSIKKITTENDEKINLIDLKLKALQNNDPLVLENKINSNFEKNRKKFEEKFDDIGAKINIIQRDLSNACFKYDRIVIDNLKVTGLIGEACPYSNLKYYIEFLHKKISELTISRDKINNELKAANNRISDILVQMKSDLEQQKYIIADMTSNRLNDANNKFLERDKMYEERISSLRLENYNFSNNLIKKTEELNIQWDKLEHIKEEIYKKFDEEKIRFKKYTEYLLNSFNLQKKEFNLIKSRFTDMSNVFKHFSTARNGFENLDRKEIIKVARRLNFDKKQKMSKEDTEMINKEEKENNILKIDGEENTNNEHQLKKKKKSDSGDFKKEDSNYSFNINNQEDENNLKLTDENFIDLDINNINKNNRKININQNNSNSDEFKNIYTKIAIKSFNKKSKEADKDINKNEDNLKDKNENEELINIKSKDGNNNTFTKILNKEMLSKLKKQKTFKKIKINDNDRGEKEEKEEKEELALTKDNFGKKFILSENDKINEFLSLSNEAKSFINNCTNTTPHNLKLKKIVKKIEFKKNEAISPLQFDNSFFKLNNDKENIFYYKIIQYIFFITI